MFHVKHCWRDDEAAGEFRPPDHSVDCAQRGFVTASAARCSETPNSRS